MGKFEQIKEAVAVFGLQEHETIGHIKSKIKNALKQWHPDSGNEDEDACTEKTVSLIQAKKIIFDYLDNYKISFEKHEIEKYLPPDELWMQRFGSDPIWGEGKQ